MNRKDKTKFLGELLKKSKLSGMGKYWASEVSIDYGTSNVRRVDFMQFQPPNAINISSIEKGIFICYEVKSCIADVYSGNGLNFVGEKNYIVTTMQCYKQILEDMNGGKFYKHLKECFPESSDYFGFIVAVPANKDKYVEFENPTELDESKEWKLEVIMNCNQGPRKRSISEMLFCMLRSGH